MKLISKLIILLILPLLLAVLLLPFSAVISSENKPGFQQAESGQNNEPIRPRPRRERNLLHSEDQRAPDKTFPSGKNNTELWQNTMPTVEHPSSQTAPPPEPPASPIVPPSENESPDTPVQNIIREYFPVALGIFKWIIIAIAALLLVFAAIIIFKRVKIMQSKAVKPVKKRKKEAGGAKKEPETISEAVSSFVKHRTRNSY